MLIQRIGSRGVLFTFEDNISVYLIAGDKRVFLCDTHLGPLSMEYVKAYIARHWPGKEVVIFNSHADWDHVWGNCAFPAALIIGHETCRARLAEIGEFELEQWADYHQGRIELVLPNVTFSDKMTFVEEDVEFIYAPGHTVDSALCFDRRDSVLFAGDLIEYPIPYLDSYDLETYLKTLKYIEHLPAEVTIAAHSGVVDAALIAGNFAYVQDMARGKPIDAIRYRQAAGVHNYNVNNRILLHFERVIREKLGGDFNYRAFRRKFLQVENMLPAQLTAALEHLLNCIEQE